MNKYQELTLTETHETLTVSTMEYPFMLAGIFYIKFIVYKTTDTIFGITYTPTKFVSLLPQNILKRENIWSQEEEDMIIAASNEAKNQEHTMAEYKAAAEEEMKKRVQQIPPTQNELDEDDDIDLEFKTPLDLLDPNYM